MRLNTIRSVQRAIKVLKYVCNNSTPAGLSQISRGVKLDKTTTWRLLITLEKNTRPKNKWDLRLPYRQ